MIGCQGRVRVRHGRAQGRAARVPAEVVQFVADVRHVQPTHDLAVAARVGIDVHRAQRIGLAAVGLDGDNVRESLGGACMAERGDS
jgi:hypothetical protein